VDLVVLGPCCRWEGDDLCTAEALVVNHPPPILLSLGRLGKGGKTKMNTRTPKRNKAAKHKHKHESIKEIGRLFPVPNLPSIPIHPPANQPSIHPASNEQHQAQQAAVARKTFKCTDNTKAGNKEVD
jgi:hypothetical protein